MSVTHVDVDMTLAPGRAEVTAPFKHRLPAAQRALLVEAQPTPPQAPPARARMPLGALNALPRPSWTAVVAAIGAVAAAVWWIMFQRIPDIDPRSVIATNLASAERALNDGRYIDPPERSAAHYYSAVLALDPTNADAMNAMDLIAERYLESAKTLIVHGRIADAVIALENVRRVRPEHRRLPLLDAQLRKELNRQVYSHPPAAEPLRNPESLSRAAKAAPPKLSEPRAASTAPAQPTLHGAAREPIANLELDTAVAALVQPAMQPPSAIRPGQSGASADPADPAAQPFVDPIVDVGHAHSGGALNIAVPAPRTIDASSIAQAPEPEPKLVKFVQPHYPRAALLRGIEGWIEVSLSIGPSGDVIEPRIEDGSSRQLFDRPALAAVRQWKYEPRPEADPEQRTRVRLKFELTN